MAKARIHNEWFMPLAKRTCECGCKKTETFAWGEYHNGKWRTILHFCQACFQERVMTRLVAHAAPCGCSFSFNARSGYSLPAFVKDAEGQCNLKAA